VTNTAAAHQPGRLELADGRGHPEGPGDRGGQGAGAEFERLYRANVDAVTAFFARRTADPQAVADLTADTFVAVITSLATFDPGKGTARAWVFGIARHVYAAHCESASSSASWCGSPAAGTSAPITSRNCSTGSTPSDPAGAWSSS
jgi:DNA-directed RNA polymerase specialized sigma24 family protein